MYRSEGGLFHVLEDILKEADAPLTCAQLYDEHAKVRELASSPNRVSDYLGNMWRKGTVLRLPAPKTNNSSARWAYQWKDGRQQDSPPGANQFMDSLKTGFFKPGIAVTDKGNTVTIELDNYIITINKK